MFANSDARTRSNAEIEEMRRFIAGWIALCLLCASQQSLSAQNSNPNAPGCVSDVSLGQNWANSIPSGEDGYTHVTFAYVDENHNRMQPDASVAARVSTAIGE